MTHSSKQAATHLGGKKKVGWDVQGREGNLCLLWGPLPHFSPMSRNKLRLDFESLRGEKLDKERTWKKPGSRADSATAAWLAGQCQPASQQPPFASLSLWLRASMAQGNAGGCDPLGGHQGLSWEHSLTTQGGGASFNCLQPRP